MSPIAATIWLVSMVVGVLITMGGGTLWIFHISNEDHPRKTA